MNTNLKTKQSELGELMNSFPLFEWENPQSIGESFSSSSVSKEISEEIIEVLEAWFKSPLRIDDIIYEIVRSEEWENLWIENITQKVSEVRKISDQDFTKNISIWIWTTLRKRFFPWFSKLQKKDMRKWSEQDFDTLLTLWRNKTLKGKKTIDILNIPFNSYFIDILNSLSKLFFTFDNPSSFWVVINWYQKKFTQTIASNDTTFYTRADIEAIDIILTQLWEDKKVWWIIEYDFFKPYIELLIIGHILNQKLFQIWQKENISFKNAKIICDEIIKIKNKTIELSKKWNIEWLIFEKVFWKKIPKREIDIFLNSELFKKLFHCSYPQESGDEMIEIAIPYEKAKLLAHLYFHGWNILWNMEFFTSSDFVLWCILNDNVDMSRAKGLSRLISLHSDDEILFSISVLWLENIKCLDSITKEDVHILWKRFININEDYQDITAQYNLSFLEELEYSDFSKVLLLNDTEIQYLSENPNSINAFLEVHHMLQQIWEDISWIHNSCQEKQELQMILDEISPISYWPNEVKRAISTIYKKWNLISLIKSHKEYIWEISSEEEKSKAIWYLDILYKYLQVALSSHRHDLIKEFFWLSIYNQEHFILALRNSSWENINISLLLGKMQYFCDVYQDFDPSWWENHSMEEIMELFKYDINSKTQSIENSKISSLKMIFWKDIEYIESLNLSEKTFLQIIKLCEKMSTSFLDIFISFLINNEASIKKMREAQIILKINLLSKIFYILQKLDIHALHSPEKFFEFIFFDDISEKDIDILDTKTEDFEGILGYKEIVNRIMKFLKYKDMDILEIAHSEDTQEDIGKSIAKKWKEVYKSNGKREWNFIHENSFINNKSRLSYNRLHKKYKQGEKDEYKDEVQKIIKSDIVYDVRVYASLFSRYHECSLELWDSQRERLFSKLWQARGNIPLGELIAFSRILLSISSLSQKEKEIIIKIIQRDIKFQSWRIHSEDIARIFFSFQWLDENFWSHIEEIISWLRKVDIKNISFSGQCIYMILQWLYNFRENSCVSVFVQYLFSNIPNPQNLDSIDSISLKIAYSLYRKNTPKTLEERYKDAALDKQNEWASTAENYLYKKVKEIYPDALQWHFIHGFELDIFIPSIWKNGLNIEFDGKIYHTNIKNVRNQRRDTYLSSLWICIYRFSSDNHEDLQQKVSSILLILWDYKGS